MTLKERVKRLKQDIPIVFLCLKDKETPMPTKIFAGITVGYALSPVDLIPDFIPLLGYLDDVIILPALVVLTIKLIPKSVWERNAEVQKICGRTENQKSGTTQSRLFYFGFW